MRIRAFAAATAGLLLAGCGSGGPVLSEASASGASTSETLTVFAALSLKETFTALGRQFESDHAGVNIVFTFGAAADLAQQIVRGAPADVFAAASDAPMKTVADAGLTAAAPTTFATNILQIATSPGNPKRIASFADLARPDTKVVICAAQLPCGAAERKIEKLTGVTLTPVSREAEVKSVLAKVESGSADAGLVFLTDVKAATPQVTAVTLAEAPQARSNYPIVVIKSSKQADLAQQFEAVVTGSAGQQALRQAGFGQP